MLHLFHGVLVDASRRELNQLREKFAPDKVKVLDGRTVTPTDLIQTTQGSLFGSDQLVIIENLVSRRLTKKGADQDEFGKLLTRIPADTEVVFWEDKEVAKSALSLFPKSADIAVFKPDRVIFSFVESVLPGNTPEILALLRECLKRDAPELIFTMLVRQLRLMIMVKDLGKQTPELTAWQVSRLHKQALRFSLEQLTDLFRKLYEIDVKIKTGSTPFDLTQELRLFLISI